MSLIASRWRLLAHQLRYEQKAYWRNPAAAMFTFAFPVMLLVIFASLNRGVRVDFLGGISYNQYYIPAIAAFSVISSCYTSLAIVLAIRRDMGLFKRLRATPLPTWGMLGGYLLSSLLVAALLVLIVFALGTVAYGLHWHGHLLALLVALVLGSVCFCSLGIAVATVVPNADAAGPIVNFALFPILFLSGTFFPLRSGSVISRVANYLPVRPFTQSVFSPFDPRTTGLGFHGRDLLTLAIWSAVAGFIAVRRFSWEPRKSG